MVWLNGGRLWHSQTKALISGYLEISAMAARPTHSSTFARSISPMPRRSGSANGGDSRKPPHSKGMCLAKPAPSGGGFGQPPSLAGKEGARPRTQGGNRRNFKGGHPEQG